MMPEDIREVQAALQAATAARSPGSTVPSPASPAALRLLADLHGESLGDHSEIIVRDGEPPLRIRAAELQVLAGALEVLQADHRTVAFCTGLIAKAVAALATGMVGERRERFVRSAAAVLAAIATLHDGEEGSCSVWDHMDQVINLSTPTLEA